MPLILPNSIFYHVGRTGGHWVSHALWKSGLVQKRLFPLHLTPIQAAGEPDFEDRPFRFCFVRHPLHWLASLWRHEMEFGWLPDSLVTKLAYSESFEIFLEKMLAAWPQGPCSEQVMRYVDDCQFVGRLENLSGDLEYALDTAGENYDKAILATPPVNESAIQAIKEAAIAPSGILQRVMDAEAAFNERFGYDSIPQSLVGKSTRSSIWPILPLKPGADLAVVAKAVAGEVAGAKFDYRFDQGGISPNHGIDRREQLDMVAALSDIPVENRRVAVLGEGDPYFAHLLKARGAQNVDFVTASTGMFAQTLSTIVDTDIRVIEFADYLRSEDVYDLIAITGLAASAPCFELDLVVACGKLADGGHLLAYCPLLYQDEATKVTWPSGSDIISFYSRDYLTNFIGNAFEATIRSSFGRSPDASFRQACYDLAGNIGADPEHIVGAGIFEARRITASATCPYDGLRQWLTHLPPTVLEQPVDLLPKASRLTVAQLKQMLDHERTQSNIAKNAVLDRSRDLVEARKEVLAIHIQFDLLNEQLRQTRVDMGRLQTERDKFFGQVAGLRDAVANRDDELTLARKELSQVRVDLGLVSEKIRLAQQDLVTLTTERDEISGIRDSLKDALAHRESDLSEARKQLSAVHIDLESARMRISEVEGELEQTRETLKGIEGLEAIIDALKT
jgi:hypothetical protein